MTGETEMKECEHAEIKYCKNCIYYICKKCKAQSDVMRPLKLWRLT